MPATTTLLNLRNSFRTLSDTKSNYPTDAEVNDWIQNGYRGLWDLLTDAGSDFLPWTSATINTSTTNDAYDLPADFFRLRGVTVLYGPLQHRVIHPVIYTERSRYENSVGWGYSYAYARGPSNVGYLVRPRTGSLAAKLMFVPAPDQVVPVRVDYYPLPTVPTLDADVIDTGNGWDTYILAYCMVQLGLKEEQNVTGWMARMQQEQDRILSAATNRDDSEPFIAADVEYGGRIGLLPPPRS